MSTEQELRQMLKGAIHLRARMYYYIFDELRKEIGEEKATEYMKRGIRRGGLDMGKQFAEYAPDDIDGLKAAFLNWVPDKGAMFAPEVLGCDHDHGLEIQFHACPLLEAYREMGLPDDEMEKILAIAAAIDHGIFGGAGFDFESTTWKPGRPGCCRLHVKPGKK